MVWLHIRRALISMGLVVLVSGCVSQSDGDAGAWFAYSEGLGPTQDRLFICHGFGCIYRSPVRYSGRDTGHLRALLARGRASPAAEREAIARAVAWNERRVAPEVGSADDRGGLDLHNAHVRGQMDCIDEATNTTSLLLMAQTRGYLRHHTVGRPVSRGFLLDGKYPHATASIREKQSGKRYAVDSWPRGNGKAPDIVALKAWMSKDY
ncbi:hypothetical protein GCM10011316_27730 [Roseibium aquae]|uniref:Uncharacterized protein n=1 Tax=Roseibium aquae TaxID=1323746 RepID=A0A916X175_9HYPH|nr:hypothetical protein [Roseibium aquae]GGB54151.1 hypothetical protein GCM10011316_27730 [Roseibium aquae]